MIENVNKLFFFFFFKHRFPWALLVSGILLIMYILSVAVGDSDHQWIILVSSSLFLLGQGCMLVANTYFREKYERMQFAAKMSFKLGESVYARRHGLEEAKRRFVANVTHELRTPLVYKI